MTRVTCERQEATVKQEDKSIQIMNRIKLKWDNGADIPEDYGTTTEEFSKAIQEAIRLSEEYLKQEEKNETNC